MKNKKSIALSAAIGVAVLGIVAGLRYGGALTWMENKSYDSRMKQTADKFEADDNIAVIVLDQESIDWAKTELGWSYPWPRESYAKMIRFVNRGKAASMAFDMIYSEPSVYGTKDDEEMADASREFGKVVQTVFYQSNDTHVPVLPIPAIKDSAAKIATVESLLDDDGVARRSRFRSSSDLKEPSLTVAGLELSDEMPELSSIPKARHSKKGESEEGMYVRYVGGLERFHPYSAKQILMSEMAAEEAEKKGIPYAPDAESDLVTTESFEGSHVFFGLYAPGLFDICATPMGTNYPGMGVHISMTNTILTESYLSDTAEAVSFAIIALMVAAGIFIASVNSQKSKSFAIKIAVFIIIAAAYFCASYAVFIAGTILPVAAPLLAFGLSFASVVTKNYLTEGKQKRYLKTAFKQYLSAEVIDNLIDNPDALKLGGEEREITAFFSDVQGFTTISESLNPTDLTNLLNKYLNAMTEIIFKHGGTIDKYEGDAIIAFWNAPTTQADHARRAVEAALECQAKLAEMQEELSAVAGKPFKQRIGLNSGRAVVGNMGSDYRFNYTMLGDSVNLAARLEGINKQFGTYTMCSKATMESAVEHGCTLSFRKLSNIAVVGKKEGVVVFEPMQNAEFDRRKDDFVNFGVGYDLFVKGDFAGAIEVFEKTRDKDPAADKYIEKCRALIKNPPEKWDGILRATEK